MHHGTGGGMRHVSWLRPWHHVKGLGTRHGTSGSTYHMFGHRSWHLCLALRANPFPKVTDPFCRLPFSTLFHRPETIHLGDR